MEILEIPSELSYSTAMDLSVNTFQFVYDAKLAIDFSKLRYSRPIGMLVIGRAIRHLVSLRKASGLPTTAVGLLGFEAAHNYLEHLGFFDFIGLPNRNPVGAAKGNARYIPIRRISREQFETKGNDSKKIRDEILDYSKEISEIISPSFDEYEANRVLGYSFKEIIRNVFEHSGANSCFITGQRWESGVVQVAVVDEGRGIRESLSQSFSVANDADALELAIKPGVSRTSKATLNEHDNSGFGLYVLSEVGRNFGQFVVGSGESALRIGLDYPPKFEVVRFTGAFVGLQLDCPPKNFAAVLDEIVKAGELEAQCSGALKKASSSSKEF